MIDGEQRTGAGPNSVVMLCPVDGCPWRHQRSEPGMGISAGIRQSLTAATAADEQAVRDHLATHPVDDFVRTIARLRDQLATTQPPALALRPGTATVRGRQITVPPPTPITPDPDGAIRGADGSILAYITPPGVSSNV